MGKEPTITADRAVVGRSWNVPCAVFGPPPYHTRCLSVRSVYGEVMADNNDGGGSDIKDKRPAIGPKTFFQIEEIAAANTPISVSELSWEKCVQVVIDEYVPDSDRKQRKVTKRLNRLKTVETENE